MFPKRQRQTSGYEARRVSGVVPREQSERIAAAAKAHGVTMNTLLQTAWGLLLHRYSGSRDVVFGGVVSGRPADLPGVESMIGLFINTLPVRVACEGQDTAADVLRRMQADALAAQAYGYYPLHEIQAHCTGTRELFDHILVFENYPMPTSSEASLDASGLAITSVQADEQTNYDLNVMIQPGEELVVHFDYNGQVYEQEAMERVQGHWLQLVEQIVSQPNVPVTQLTGVRTGGYGAGAGSLAATGGTDREPAERAGHADGAADGRAAGAAADALQRYGAGAP
ncbi:hypothetical protein ASF12_33195 [Paenibacillus sp. Leaf72]|nr:hypothetical protein ASF12_33195 [Paenibacillus sp. Leaf72]